MTGQHKRDIDHAGFGDEATIRNVRVCREAAEAQRLLLDNVGLYHEMICKMDMEDNLELRDTLTHAMTDLYKKPSTGTEVCLPKPAKKTLEQPSCSLYGFVVQNGLKTNNLRELGGCVASRFRDEFGSDPPSTVICANGATFPVRVYEQAWLCKNIPTLDVDLE